MEPQEKEDDWPQHPPHVLAKAAQVTAGDRRILRITGALFIGMAALPWLIGFAGALRPTINRLWPPPTVQVRGEGYIADFHTRSRRGNGMQAYFFIGTGSDGKCYAAYYPVEWDIGLCAARLRQIAAGDCAVAPEGDSDTCRRVIGDMQQPGAKKRRARMIFYVHDGEALEASEER
jgi:hypothetical protein